MSVENETALDAEVAAFVATLTSVQPKIRGTNMTPKKVREPLRFTPHVFFFPRKRFSCIFTVEKVDGQFKTVPDLEKKIVPSRTHTVALTFVNRVNAPGGPDPGRTPPKKPVLAPPRQTFLDLLVTSGLPYILQEKYTYTCEIGFSDRTGRFETVVLFYVANDQTGIRFLASHGQQLPVKQFSPPVYTNKADNLKLFDGGVYIRVNLKSGDVRIVHPISSVKDFIDLNDLDEICGTFMKGTPREKLQFIYNCCAFDDDNIFEIEGRSFYMNVHTRAYLAKGGYVITPWDGVPT